ncbi:interferon-inducible GTPase 1-like [Mercenaria mercenaria]|uniref:interferon-inducible GTPase 1-like n=1 Tax=Mercenaria mercenaria TaxID=6596 RepID=UPI00234E67C0|nr:interferon-inducible GTPase 1-like [Mercenaria mercenaria]
MDKRSEEFKSTFQKQGVAGLSQAIFEDLDGWKNENINIAVLGQSGVGKSSFINALLGLKPSDEGAAAVGLHETTNEKKSYVHPKNKNFLIWDFPGVGTKNFPREEYLAKVDFRIFNYFILITSKRFFEYDIWLAHAVEMTRKCFYFVRSMFGNDIENEMNKKRKR